MFSPLPGEEMKAYLPSTALSPAASVPVTRAWMISPSYSGMTDPSKPRGAGSERVPRTKSAMCAPSGAGIPSSWRTLRLKRTGSVPLLVSRIRAEPAAEASAAWTERAPAVGTECGCGACRTTSTPPSARSVLKVLKTDSVRAPVSGSKPSSEAPSRV